MTLTTPTIVAGHYRRVRSPHARRIVCRPSWQAWISPGTRFLSGTYVWQWRGGADALSVDKSQLLGQLLARIPESREALRASMQGWAERADGIWLRPRRPTLWDPSVMFAVQD